jgi:RecA-family ATPase
VKRDINALHQLHGDNALIHMDEISRDELDAKIRAATGQAPANGSEPGGAGAGHGKAAELKATTAAELLKTKAPARKWVVSEWFPDATTTLLGGDGAVGKGILAGQLLWACATGREWLGMTVKKCQVLYVSCEDDTDEIHRRIEKLHEHEPCATGLENFHIIDLVGEIDSEIATFQHEKLNLTDLHNKIEAYVQKHKIGLLVLDASADVFGGDEIAKRQVRAFIRALNGLARKYNCAIILIAHPSKAGMRDGTNYSGNVAWNNSVRARAYFEAINPKGASDKDEDDTEADSGRRVLKLPKSNRSRPGQKVYLRWDDWRFVLDSAKDGVSIEQGVEDEALFLKILDKMIAEGRSACVTTGHGYAPKAFAEHPLGKGVSRERFRQAMERLLSVGKIINQPEGPPSKQRWKLVRTAQ